MCRKKSPIDNITVIMLCSHERNEKKQTGHKAATQTLASPYRSSFLGPQCKTLAAAAVWRRQISNRINHINFATNKQNTKNRANMLTGHEGSMKLH